MVASAALDDGTIADELANESDRDDIFGEGTSEEEEEKVEEENVRENEELGVMDDIGLGLNGGLYEFSRVMVSNALLIC
jgi:hypothetical protein